MILDNVDKELSEIEKQIEDISSHIRTLESDEKDLTNTIRVLESDELPRRSPLVEHFDKALRELIECKVLLNDKLQKLVERKEALIDES